MNKTLLTSFFLILAFSVFSQSQIGFKVSFLNPSYKLTSTPPNSTEIFTVENGLSYSLDYKRRWPGLFNFGAGIDYHRKQSHFLMDYKSLGTNVKRDVDYTVDYLNIHLLPEFVYGEKLRTYFQVGPYIGFLLSSNVKGERIVSDNNGSITIEEDERVSENFPGIDWGVFFGAGAEYPISKSIKLAIELQYARGFAGFAKEDQYVFATKNFTAGISFIYVFKGYASRISGDE
ncbi:MAG: hypothetical protein DSY76_00930 [Bacteroidetes bacterium]|nr:MAG: hypothetical protein DSY76_00930 [Bacteroidota bacterium]